MNTIGIRREDKDEWEARAPLVPDDVARLVRSDLLRFTVQPSTQRVFPEEAYLRAGAHVEEDLSACDVVLAVKEIPRDFLLPGRTYAFFSHTIKGQPYNMDMLRRLMALRCQLIDFERVTDDRGRRLIYFSRFAGLAGSMDTLWALGRRLQCEGLTPNPFAAVEQTYRYPALSDALAAVREAAERILADGLPAELCPFVVGISGYGNVSLGAQEVVDALGATSVGPAELDGLFAAPADRHAVYKVVFAEQDMVVRRDAVAPFDLDEYYHHPELYAGKFDAWLPRLAVLLNCVYWEDAYPRLVTKSAVRRLFAGAPPLLRVIGDISCDIEGSVELTARETHIDDPVYVYDPESESIADGVAGKGPVVLAVGNLPCELPREASAAFSAALSPFVPALAAADFDAPRELLGLPAELRRALILHHGELTPDYAYMQRFV
jgi:saccharopine dehydrogenase (NAD+, L-lysine forming)